MRKQVKATTCDWVRSAVVRGRIRATVGNGAAAGNRVSAEI